MGLARRLAFHDVLIDVLGSNYVYFQPPPDRQLQYPCIVYERDSQSVKRSDNLTYNLRQRYQVTYIDQNPDGDPIDALSELPLSAFSRHFVTSGLNHDVFSIYY
jgi:hypothetical protein